MALIKGLPTATFKFNGATAEDLKTFQAAFTSNDMSRIGKFIATYVLDAPDAWGDAKDPNTYLQGSYLKVVKPAAKAFYEALNDEAEVFIGGEIVFDVYAITGEQFQEIAAIKPLDFGAQATVLSQFTLGVDTDSKHFPKGFKHDQAESYLKLPIRIFRACWVHFVGEVNSKN